MADQSPNTRLFILLGAAILLLGAGALLIGGRLREGSESDGLLRDDQEPQVTTDASEPTAEMGISAAEAGQSSPTAPPQVLPDFQVPVGISNVHIDFVIDASASMAASLDDGMVKQEALRALFSQPLTNLSTETNLGLRVFGQAGCRDVQTIATLRSGQQDAIAGWASGFQAGGQAPIQLALSQVFKDFSQAAGGQANHIVLISDGLDSCGGDPCQWMKAQSGRLPHVTLHVIGLGITSSVQEDFSCLADYGGGFYFDVNSRQDLSTALDTIFSSAAAEEVIVSFPMATATAQIVADQRNATRSFELAQVIDSFVTSEATQTPIPPTATSTPTVTVTATPTFTATATLLPLTSTFTPSPIPPPTAAPENDNSLSDPSSGEDGCSGVSCQDAGAVGSGSSSGGGGGNDGPSADPGVPGG